MCMPSGWKTILNLLVAGILWSGCNPSVRFAANPEKRSPVEEAAGYREGQVLNGVVSYYAGEYHGKKTANGEIYNMYAKTAAHRYLPFHTILRVTNSKNGKSVIVRINDRGPFKDNRILDLSYQAAREIDMLITGTVQAEITIIRLGE
jgi:rare lipoprotein A (peptidoglycan hydrolase)